MSLWDSLGAGFALADATGGTIGVCPRYAEILGRSHEAALGLTMEAVTHPDDILVNRRLLDEIAYQIGSFVLRKRYIKADQTIQWVENRVVSFGRSNVLPAYMMACYPIAAPTFNELIAPPLDDRTSYIAEMATQLGQMAGGARLDDAADLLRLAAAAIKPR
jgi:PAS domain-containing protein